MDALDNPLKNIEKMTQHLNDILALNKQSIGLIHNSTFKQPSVRHHQSQRQKYHRRPTANLSELSNELKDAGLNKTSQKASSALDSITLSLNTLRGTLSNASQTISHADLPFLAQKLIHGDGLLLSLTDEELYANPCVSTSRHLHLLLQDIPMHPERYTSAGNGLFGKNKPGKYANPITDPAYQLLVDSLDSDYNNRVKQLMRMNVNRTGKCKRKVCRKTIYGGKGVLPEIAPRFTFSFLRSFFTLFLF